MIQRLFVAFIVLVAVIAGICATSLPRDEIARLGMFRVFFDMALPILAFGALVKYLCSCCHPSCKCGACNSCSNTCNNCKNCNSNTCTCTCHKK